MTPFSRPPPHLLGRSRKGGGARRCPKSPRAAEATDLGLGSGVYANVCHSYLGL